LRLLDPPVELRVSLDKLQSRAQAYKEIYPIEQIFASAGNRIIKTYQYTSKPLFEKGDRFLIYFMAFIYGHAIICAISDTAKQARTLSDCSPSE